MEMKEKKIFGIRNFSRRPCDPKIKNLTETGDKNIFFVGLIFMLRSVKLSCRCIPFLHYIYRLCGIGLCKAGQKNIVVSYNPTDPCQKPPTQKIF